MNGNQRKLDALDALAFTELATIARGLAPAASPAPHRAPPVKVDLGQYLHYIRKQGSGCFAYSLLAVWDIMNEMACPYTPNLAVAPWMFLHRRRDLWEKLGGTVTRDGRFISWKTGPEFGLFQEFGNPTEGTELIGFSANAWCGTAALSVGSSNPERRGTVGWTVEGINESQEYRLAGWPQPLAEVDSNALVQQLAVGRPMRVTIPSWNHFVALVGYDYAAKTFTYVDSAGDRALAGGFGTFTFAQVDDSTKPIISKAEVIEIHPPRPVPAARIRITHSSRMNFALWLSVEGSPIPKRQIWPPPQLHDDLTESIHQGRWFPWDDSSDNLHYTVRLPTELMWPPDQENRLVLDLHDSAAVTDTGGELHDFTAAFGGHIMKCEALNQGPVEFGPYTHQRFFIG